MFIQGHRLPNNKRKDNANLFPLYNGKSPGDEVGATMWLALDKLSFRLQIIRSFTDFSYFLVESYTVTAYDCLPCEGQIF